MNASIKPLRESLRARGLNFRTLANLAGVQYTHLSAVLAGRRPGRFTWRRIMPYLSDAEMALVTGAFGELPRK